jgi:hypothetical protein
MQVGGSPLVSAMLLALASACGVVYVTCVGLFVGFAGTHNDPTLPGDTAVLVGQGHTRDLTHTPLLHIYPLVVALINAVNG